MAGDWIKVETALPDKPEVWAIAEALDIDPDAVVGKLLRVWRWFDAHTENGDAPSVTQALLDREAGVRGFAEAMVCAGWMRRDGDRLRLPNFDRHNGKTAKTRALTAKRQAQYKRSQGAESDAKGDDANVTDASPREEKRRGTDSLRSSVPRRSAGEELLEDRIRPIYPKRSGDQRWADAAKAINARLKEGHPADELIAGTQRYARWCEATDKLGTERVRQAATFFGTNRGFLNAWDLPRQPVASAGESSTARMHRRLRERVAAKEGASHE